MSNAVGSCLVREWYQQTFWKYFYLWFLPKVEKFICPCFCFAGGMLGFWNKNVLTIQQFGEAYFSVSGTMEMNVLKNCICCRILEGKLHFKLYQYAKTFLLSDLFIQFRCTLQEYCQGNTFPSLSKFVFILLRGSVRIGLNI